MMAGTMNTAVKGLLLVAAAYAAAMGLAICMLTITVALVADTHSCNALGRALVAAWSGLAVVFAVSMLVTAGVAWKILPGCAGRLAVVAALGAALLVSFAVIAFGLLVAFNC